MSRNLFFYSNQRTAVHGFSIASVCLAGWLFAATPCAMSADTSSMVTSSASDYRLGFGPFIGSGRADPETKVRQASGYLISFERGFQVADSLSIGPRLELANTFVNTKREQDGKKAIGTYDNRMVAAGVSARYELPHADIAMAPSALYLSIVGGRGYSKLSLDESTQDSYRQNLFQGLDGSYFASEVGSFIPLKGNFGIDVAMHGSFFDVDQSRASGTYQGDRIENGALLLVAGSHDTQDNGLAKAVKLRTYGLKVALTLGF